MSTRYGAFTFRTQCRHCGHPVPVNLPASETHCPSCQQTMQLPAAAFVELLYAFDDPHLHLAESVITPHNREVEGLPITATFRRMVKPLCEKCSQPYREERIAEGESKDIFCSSCGDPASTTPVAAWLQRGVPQARQLVSVDRGAGSSADGGTGPELQGESEARPVVMACPSCGGSLRVTKESSRMLPCQYCPAEIYLPDPVWLRLHPARTVREWFVRFEGLTRPELAAQLAEEQRRAQIATDERANAEREARVDVAKRSAYLWLGLLYTLIALTMLGTWASVSTGHSVPPGQWLPAVGLALAPQAVIALVAYAKASAVVQLATDADSDHMLSWIGLWALFGLFAFPFGPIVFFVAIARLMGDLGSSKMSVNGRTAFIHGRKLHRGEGIPIALFFLAQFPVFPAEAALLLHHYTELGSCKSSETIGAGGQCQRCGGNGETCCPRARGRCYCGATLVLDPTTSQCVPKRR